MAFNFKNTQMVFELFSGKCEGLEKVWNNVRARVEHPNEVD